MMNKLEREVLLAVVGALKVEADKTRFERERKEWNDDFENFGKRINEEFEQFKIESEEDFKNWCSDADAEFESKSKEMKDRFDNESCNSESVKERLDAMMKELEW